MSAMKPSPYANFPFRVLWQGRTVAGVTRFRNDGSVLTLERGLTHDRAFDEWCKRADARRDLSIQLFGSDGELSTTFHFSRCQPLRYDATPELDGEGQAFVFATLTLETQLLGAMS